MIDDVNNVASYTMSHKSTHILRMGLSGSSVVKSVGFNGEEIKGNACRNLKTMGKSINPALHAWVVVDRVVVEVIEFRCIPL